MVAPRRQLWLEDIGQDIAKYAVMLAVILVLVVGRTALAQSCLVLISPTIIPEVRCGGCACLGICFCQSA